MGTFMPPAINFGYIIFSVSQHFGIDVHNSTSEQKDENPRYNFLDWRLRPNQQ